MDKIKTGALIREARTKKNYTQSELGDLVGVTNKAVSRWENGESFPDVGVIEKLSEVLDIRIQDIVTGGVKIDEYKEEQMESVFSDVIHSMKKDRRKIIFNFTLIGILLFFLMVGIRSNHYFPDIHVKIGAKSWGIFPAILLVFFLIMLISCKFILRSLPDAKHRIFEKRSIIPLGAIASGLTVIPVIIQLSVKYSSSVPDKSSIIISIAILLPYFISFMSFINELSMDDFSLYKFVFASSAMFLFAGYRNECGYLTSKAIFFRNIYLIQVFILAETALMILFIRKRIYR